MEEFRRASVAQLDAVQVERAQCRPLGGVQVLDHHAALGASSWVEAESMRHLILREQITHQTNAHAVEQLLFARVLL